jgi:ERCC4-type nuclease
MNPESGCLIRLSVPEAAAPAPAAPAATAATAASLHIDYREDSLKSSLSIPYMSATLDVGDIWVGVSVGTENKPAPAPALVLERKTVADWESSLMDGRYREQRGRLLAFSQETGARVAYILEGKYDATRRLSGGAKAIMKLVSRMSLLHGIPVFHTLNVKETAQFVEAMQEYWEKEGTTTFAAAATAQRAADGIKVAKKDNLDDPRLFAIRCIAQVPGVSVAIAEAILDACGGSLASVMSANEDTIANTKVGTAATRRVGPAIARRVSSLFTPKSQTDS